MIGCTTMPAIDRIVQQIATGMPGKPRLRWMSDAVSLRVCDSFPRRVLARLAYQKEQTQDSIMGWLCK
jgi:hypothetical protein